MWYDGCTTSSEPTGLLSVTLLSTVEKIENMWVPTMDAQIDKWIDGWQNMLDGCME